MTSVIEEMVGATKIRVFSNLTYVKTTHQFCGPYEYVANLF